MPKEDYTTATITDPLGQLTVAPNKITYTGLTRSADTLVVFDKGVGHFVAGFDHLVNEQEDTNTGALYALWALTNDVDDILGLSTNNKSHFHIRRGPNYIQLIQQAGAVLTADTWLGAVLGTRYYVRPKESGGIISVFIYDDPSRSAPSLVATLSLPVAIALIFQFVFGLSSYNDGLLTTMSGDVSDLDLQEAVGAGKSRSGFAHPLGIKSPGTTGSRYAQPLGIKRGFN